MIQSADRTRSEQIIKSKKKIKFFENLFFRFLKAFERSSEQKVIEKKVTS